MTTPASMLAMNRTSPALLLMIGVSMQTAEAGMIDKEGMAPWEICGLCHGLDGNSHMPRFPKLAAQKATYIEAQFNAFRQGARTNDGGQMQAITEEVKPEDIAAIAQHFTQQAAPEPVERPMHEIQQDADLLQLGKALYTSGRAGLPACTTCHNAERPDTPWLDAQHEDYLNKQLDDFREGSRHSGSQNVMQDIADSLTRQEQKAVTHYLSRSALRAQENLQD